MVGVEEWVAVGVVTVVVVWRCEGVWLLCCCFCAAAHVELVAVVEILCPICRSFRSLET